VNAAGERLFGRPRLELLGHVAWHVAPEPLASELRAAFGRGLAGEEVALLRNCFAQGRWFEVAAARLHEVIVLSARGVTERLQAEALRRQAEERFRILVDGVKDYAISMLDIEGRIASWNVGGERAFDSLRSDGRRGRRDQEEIRANTPCRLSVRGAGRGARALRALEVPQSPKSLAPFASVRLRKSRTSAPT